MYKSKRFAYSYEETQENGKNASTMIDDILADKDFLQLEEIVIGCWGEPWENGDGAQALIDGIVSNREKFARVKSLFIGDMDYEDCEVSWIVQADYSALWQAMPQLEKLTIKGSVGLSLGEIRHEHLKCLEIICGGLPASVMKQIQDARLPSLEKLLLYIGVEDYGFDGDMSTVRALLEKSDFPDLSYLGLTDSELQDEIAEAVLESKYITQIQTLDLSMGTLTDVGGQLLLDQIGHYPNVKTLDLHYHFLSDNMMTKLSELNAEVYLEGQESAEGYGGEIYYPMLTE